MDGNFELELSEIRRAVTDAEVLSIFFPLVGKSLIIDTRCSIREGPMVRLAPQAGSSEERCRSLQRMRPKFPRPDNFVAIPWPRYVGTLVQSRAAEWIRHRLEQSGYSKPLLALDKAIEEVHRLERLELTAAVLGYRYHTIWSRRKQPGLG
ncbi:MAG: hypothetical protein EXR53_04585 [Dehalococcoidia bacterium]|nr:hypothetical protein [Dehalococcoidia bacterium]